MFGNLFENKITWNHTAKRMDYQPISINKIYFDFDIPNEWKGTWLEGQRQVERDIETLKQRLKTRGFTDRDLLKVWTTKKGSHLYVKIQRIEGLMNLDFLDEIYRKMKGFQQYMTRGLVTADTKVFAEFSRVSRVPGIERHDTNLVPMVVDHRVPLNKHLHRYKTWSKLAQYGNEELYQWGNGIQYIDDFVKLDDYKHVGSYVDHRVNSETVQPIGMDRAGRIANSEERKGLEITFKLFMSDEMVEKFMSFAPDNDIRVSGAASLLEGGCNVDVIINLIELLGWANFNYEVTYSKLLDIIKWKA